MFIHFLFTKSCLYEILWKNVVDMQATDDNMACAHYLLDNQGYTHTHTHTHTRTEYVILFALPWQQWLRGSSSVFGYKYLACLI
jgi:hypothetical protein